MHHGSRADGYVSLSSRPTWHQPSLIRVKKSKYFFVSVPRYSTLVFDQVYLAAKPWTRFPGFPILASAVFPSQRFPRVPDA